MSLIRSGLSLDFIKAAYEGDGDLVLTSLQVREEQKTLLKELARRNNISQAAILRNILDEWCVVKIKEEQPV